MAPVDLVEVGGDELVRKRFVRSAREDSRNCLGPGCRELLIILAEVDPERRGGPRAFVYERDSDDAGTPSRELGGAERARLRVLRVRLRLEEGVVVLRAVLQVGRTNREGHRFKLDGGVFGLQRDWSDHVKLVRSRTAYIAGLPSLRRLPAIELVLVILRDTHAPTRPLGPICADDLLLRPSLDLGPPDLGLERALRHGRRSAQLGRQRLRPLLERLEPPCEAEQVARERKGLAVDERRERLFGPAACFGLTALAASEAGDLRELEEVSSELQDLEANMGVTLRSHCKAKQRAQGQISS